jgi:8-oxo-dGTP diphosphatase
MDKCPGQNSVSVAGVIVDGQHRALPQAGVCREVREETGLSVTPLNLSGVYKNMRRGIVSLVFRCQVLDGELTTNDEVSDFRWATREEVTILVDEAFAVRVLDALEERTAPAVRQHDGVHLI